MFPLSSNLELLFAPGIIAIAELVFVNGNVSLEPETRNSIVFYSLPVFDILYCSVIFMSSNDNARVNTTILVVLIVTI